MRNKIFDNDLWEWLGMAILFTVLIAVDIATMVVIFTGHGNKSELGTFLCGVQSTIIFPGFVLYWKAFIEELVKKLKERRKTDD